jgi:hypothetical protein
MTMISLTGFTALSAGLLLIFSSLLLQAQGTQDRIDPTRSDPIPFPCKHACSIMFLFRLCISVLNPLIEA